MTKSRAVTPRTAAVAVATRPRSDVLRAQGLAQKREIHQIAAHPAPDPSRRPGLGENPDPAGDLPQTDREEGIAGLFIVVDADQSRHGPGRGNLGQTETNAEPPQPLGPALRRVLRALAGIVARRLWDQPSLYVLTRRSPGEPRYFRVCSVVMVIVPPSHRKSG